MPKEKLALGLKEPTNVHKFLKNVVYMPVTSVTPKKPNEINITRLLGILNRYQLMAEYLSKQQNLPFEKKSAPAKMGTAKL